MPEPEKEKKVQARNRKFRVIKGQVGPWRYDTPGGTVFDEDTFKRLNPEPKEGADKEGYHDALLGRLIVLEVIREVPDTEKTTPTPIGPGGEKGHSAGTIADSAKAVIDQRAAIAQSVAARPAEGEPQAAPRPEVKQGGQT